MSSSPITTSQAQFSKTSKTMGTVLPLANFQLVLTCPIVSWWLQSANCKMTIELGPVCIVNPRLSFITGLAEYQHIVKENIYPFKTVRTMHPSRFVLRLYLVLRALDELFLEYFQIFDLCRPED
jgi:hypothetical protein